MNKKAGIVIWFTGLPGSGKTTIAQEIFRRLEKQGFPVEYLDGDQVREIFPLTGFGRDARNEHIRRIGFLASKLEKHGIFVVASFISPFQESRDFVRQSCQNFIEVYLDTPLEVCQRRDPKGLYKQANQGKILNLTGIQDPYEVPSKPELTLDTSQLTIGQTADAIMKAVNGWKKRLQT